MLLMRYDAITYATIDIPMQIGVDATKDCIDAGFLELLRSHPQHKVSEVRLCGRF